MLRSIGPLHIGHSGSEAANSSLTHALHSPFLHFQIFVGLRASLLSLPVVTPGLFLSYPSFNAINYWLH
jgi:hypothetical protein